MGRQGLEPRTVVLELQHYLPFGALRPQDHAVSKDLICPVVLPGPGSLPDPDLNQDLTHGFEPWVALPIELPGSFVAS
jgi:hypothetical protein